MKKHCFLFVLISVSVFVIACGGNKSADEVTSDTELVDSLQNTPAKHTFFGIYNGILPCPNCAGIQTIMHLKEDGTYTKRFIYLGTGNDDVQVEEGTFSWNPEGTVLTLSTLNTPATLTQYIVGVDNITQLNEAGQPFQGSNAGQYVLNRSKEILTGDGNSEGKDSDKQDEN